MLSAAVAAASLWYSAFVYCALLKSIVLRFTTASLTWIIKSVGTYVS